MNTARRAADGSRTAKTPPDLADNVLDTPHGCGPAIPDIVTGIPVPGRRPGACHQGGALPSGRTDHNRRHDIQQDLHGPRYHAHLSVYHPVCIGSRQLLCPDNDPIQGHGIPETQRNRILDDPAVRRAHMAWICRLYVVCNPRPTPSSAPRVQPQTCGSLA